jgi:multiple sugar transport system ATP-binding protein
MVFQSYALYPHMSVYENMSFALKLAKVDPKVIQEKVERAASILNLSTYLQRTPKELSGGQRQRVAIGRAIVRNPKVFLFDEIEQVGTPLDLYDKPANQFVAQFIGTPQMNVVKAVDLPEFAAISRLAVPTDGHIGLRPESVVVGSEHHTPINGTVELVEALGAETLIHLRTDRGAQLVSRQAARTSLHAGERVGVTIDTAAAHLFDADGRITRTGAPAVPNAA